MTPSNEKTSSPDRRAFLKEACAVAVGGLAFAVPALAGAAVFFDPLHSGNSGAVWSLVTSVASLPDDGSPRQFRIVAERRDAWSRLPQTAVGAVYLRKTGENKIRAFNVVCPHAGCFVDYKAETKSYLCPCHNSRFDLDGAVSDPRSPTPRRLDELEVEVRHDTEIWVRFENYFAGRAEKVAVT